MEFTPTDITMRPPKRERRWIYRRYWFAVSSAIKWNLRLPISQWNTPKRKRRWPVINLHMCWYSLGEKYSYKYHNKYRYWNGDTLVLPVDAQLMCTEHIFVCIFFIQDCLDYDESTDRVVHVLGVSLWYLYKYFFH